MPTTYSAYRAYDQESGAYVTPSIPSIIDVITLAGVSVSSGSNVVTVTSTDGLFPGMALFVPNVPQGAYIHAIKSTTEIIAYAPVYDSATGTYTTTAAGANATASASSMTGHARGFNEWGIPMPVMDGSSYRNEHGQTGAAWAGFGNYSSGGGTGTAEKAVAAQGGVLLVPDAISVTAIGPSGSQTGVTVGASAITVQQSDTIKKVPPRPLPKWVMEMVLVASTGAVTRIRKSPMIQVVRTGASTATV